MKNTWYCAVILLIVLMFSVTGCKEHIKIITCRAYHADYSLEGYTATQFTFKNGECFESGDLLTGSVPFSTTACLQSIGKFESANRIVVNNYNVWLSNRSGLIGPQQFKASIPSNAGECTVTTND